MGKHNKQKGGNVAEKSHHTNTKPQQHNLSPIPNKPSTSSTLSELQQKFKAKLEGGRFRFINGTMVVCMVQRVLHLYATH